jgi:ATP-binding cassette subfamily B protein
VTTPADPVPAEPRVAAADARHHPERDGAPRRRRIPHVRAKAQKTPVGPADGASDPAGRRPSPRRLARLAAILFFDGFRAAPGWMALVTAMLVLGSVAATCYPLGYRLLADGALSGNAGELTAGVAVVAVLLGLAWVLVAIGSTEAMTLSDRIAVYRTRRMIELISGVPTVEHLERPDYLAQVERLNSGRRQLASAPRQILSNVSMAARVIVLLVLLGSVSPWLLLLPVTAAPPLAADRLAKRITKKSEDAMAADRRLAGMIFDLSANASAAGELRSYGLAPHLKSLHASLAGSLDRRAAREARKVLAVQSAGWLLYAAGLMGAIAFVAVRASEGAITLGTVLMTVSLIRRSRAQLASTASVSAGMVATLATADRLLWLEDHHVAAVAAAGTAPAPGRLTSGIALRDLSFTYPGTERAVLSSLNLTFPAGTTVAIVGENGSGKTTLVKLLLGMYQPTSGTIEVDGVPLNSISHESWRERCTAAFQDFARFSLPAVESVGVADLPELSSEPLALAALDRAGAAELTSQLPDGLATYVGGPYTAGHNLSGGQWQKLALGRAMRSVNPLLVVLDEPTASLDAHAEQALFDRYTEAASGYAAASGTITLLVSHRFATVRMADLIVYLEEGHAAEAGSHDELLARGGRYAELFTLQAAAYR